MAFVKVVGGSEIYNFRIQSLVHFYSKFWSYSCSNRDSAKQVEQPRSVSRRRVCAPAPLGVRARVPPEATAGRGRTPSELRSFHRTSRAPRRSESSGPSAAFPPSCAVLRREPSRRRHQQSARAYLRPPALPPRARPRSHRSTAPAMAAT
jgi:hypothetical protein